MQIIVISAIILTANLSFASKASKKCSKISAKEIAMSYLESEFNGWRLKKNLNAACAQKVDSLETFQGWEEGPPKTFLVDKKSAKITKSKLLDIQMQRYAIHFQVNDNKGKTLKDFIVFEKASHGVFSNENPCARLLFPPNSGVYLASECRSKIKK